MISTRYHWAFITGPKVEQESSQGRLYHAKNGMEEGSWSIEDRSTSLTATNALLARVVVGKIADKICVHEILCGVPAKLNDPSWNCVTWVKEVLEALQKYEKAISTSVLSWQTVRDAAMEYVQIRGMSQHMISSKRTRRLRSCGQGLGLSCYCWSALSNSDHGQPKSPNRHWRMRSISSSFGLGSRNRSM